MTSQEQWISIASCGSCGSSDYAHLKKIGETNIVRCAGCGTLRSDRAISPDAVYVEGYHKGEVDHPLDYTQPQYIEYEVHNNNRRLAWIEKFVPPTSLIDIGGGTGTLTAVAIERGWKATNLEPVSDAVTFSESKGIPTILGGVDDLASSPSRYDVACMMHVLEHLPNSRESLEKVRDALEPGGHVVVEVPNVASMARKATGDEWLGWWPGQHIYHFDRASLRETLRRAGFEVVADRTFVLSWEGLILDHYAYIIGISGLLNRFVSAKKALKRQNKQAETSQAQGGMPPTIRDQPFKAKVIEPLMRGIAKVEEITGTGETVIALAKRIP